MEIKRKLATIQTIDTVNDIPGADRIKMITFKSSGWKCVTGIDSNPQPGDKRIYFEVDSVLPKLDIFKFMEPYNYRVKTIKLKGQVSQGLTLPLDECLTAFNIATPVGTDDGADLTDLLGIVKYEIPETTQIGGDTKGPFPGFIEKTDEERAQNLENIEEILSKHEFNVTIKVDGSSGTFYLYNGEFGVCSRNQELKDTEGNIFWKMARKYDIENRMKIFSTSVSNMNFVIQGEVVGPGIQNNRLGLTENRLLVFTIQNIDKAKRASNNEIQALLDEMNRFGECAKFETVPSINSVPPLKTLADVATLAEGTNLINDKPREGIVLRAKDDPSISFKFINPKYLIKYDL